MSGFLAVVSCIYHAFVYFICAKWLYPMKRKMIPAFLFFMVGFSALLFKLDATTLKGFLFLAAFVGLFFSVYLEDRRCIRCAVVEFVLTALLARILTASIFLFTKGNLLDYRDYMIGEGVLPIILFTVLLLMISKLKTIFIVSEKLKRLRRDEVRFISFINSCILLVTVIISDGYLKLIARQWRELSGLGSIQLLLVIGIFFFVMIALFIRSFAIMLFYSNIKYRVLNERASSDSLTGVLTREAGTKTLKRLMKESVTRKKPLTIGFVDINNLKVVNDKYGHPEGDRLIEIISNHMKQNLRKTEFVCRMGGDEFLIIFNQSALPTAQKIWKRIHESIIQYNGKGLHPYEIGVSIGFASYDTSKHPDIKTFIGEADQEMYKNKRLTKKGR